MLETQPMTYEEIQHWGWDEIAPLYVTLLDAPITPDTVDSWLRDYKHIFTIVYELYARLRIRYIQDITDTAAKTRYLGFVESVMPEHAKAADALNRKYVASGLVSLGMETPLRAIRAELDTFRVENLPLLAEQQKLFVEDSRIIGAQTVTIDGHERTLEDAGLSMYDPDRTRRETVWHQVSERQLADRDARNDIWVNLFHLRRKVASNAGFNDYRAFRWQTLGRFDYTPEDSLAFGDAIEAVVVPAAARIYARRQARLGLDSLRPWDLDVDLSGRPPLQPFKTITELETKTGRIIEQISPDLYVYYKTMRDKKLFDLDNRLGKAAGGGCNWFPLEDVPFIFANFVGTHDDVQTLFHEVGHAFHRFERRKLRYIQQSDTPMEFNEVASMAMELLAAPYLSEFYSPDDVKRARRQHLEKIILFWPYMAVVDGFQHWAYTHADDAQQPAACDEMWSQLWSQFIRGVDWSGLDAARVTGWQRKHHIFYSPFYYVEYGMAQLGALQVWQRALTDWAVALRDYRKALALGGTVPLPDLYTAAGIQFAFDEAMLTHAVSLLESALAELGD